MNLQETNVRLQRSIQSEEDRISRYDWRRIDSELSSYGSAVLQKLLTPKECQQIAALYSEEEHFRSHIIMARHGFGKGEYRYFKYPLPKLLASLRTALYSRLAPIANQWSERMGEETRYPAEHVDFLKRCHNRGQLRPTPLLLQYAPGDYNCLHQDLYGVNHTAENWCSPADHRCRIHNGTLGRESAFQLCDCDRGSCPLRQKNSPNSP